MYPSRSIPGTGAGVKQPQLHQLVRHHDRNHLDTDVLNAGGRPRNRLPAPTGQRGSRATGRLAEAVKTFLLGIGQLRHGVALLVAKLTWTRDFPLCAPRCRDCCKTEPSTKVKISTPRLPGLRPPHRLEKSTLAIDGTGRSRNDRSLLTIDWLGCVLRYTGGFSRGGY